MHGKGSMSSGISAAMKSAIASYCLTMTHESPPGWPVRKLLNEYKRYYACFMLIRNYYAWHEGCGAIPNLARLKEVSGLSPRQTIDLIKVLRIAGLIDSDSVSGDSRQSILRPTLWLLQEVGRSCIAFLQAYDGLHQTAHASRFRSTADDLGILIRRSGDRVLEEGTTIGLFPTVQNMAEFDCGYSILVAVMAAYYGRASGGPPFPLTYDSLAWRFQVSRSHVGNVLNHLQSQQLIDAERTPSRALIDEFEKWCEVEMTHYANLASRLSQSGTGGRQVQ